MIAVGDLKICTGCSKEKTLSEFSKKSNARDGLTPKCKACESDLRKLVRRKNICRKIIPVVLFKKCGACGVSKAGRDTHLDHCHSSGMVRGYLCSSCNPGIGKFRDSSAIILRAIAYLEKHKEGDCAI
jgi:hypothetical protein